MSNRTIVGQIIKLFFTSDSFCAGLIKTDEGQPIKFSIKFPVSLDERCKLKGSFKRHEKYGWQFEADRIHLELPIDSNGLIRFLSESKYFKNIGQTRAEQIVELANGNFEEVLFNRPEKFLKIKGVTQNTITNLQLEWRKRKDVNAAITVLSGMGLTMNQTNKVIAKFGQSAVSVVKENPYSLIEAIDGFGFRKSDEIALKSGTTRNSTYRINAGLTHVVSKEIDEGHTWIDERTLLFEADRLLRINQLNSEEIIHDHLESLLNTNKLKCYSYHGTSVIALPQLFYMESYLFSNIKSKKQIVKKDLKTDLEINTLTDGQRNAFIGATQNSQYLITGPGGGGKTFLLNQLLQYFQNKDLKVTLCAPTGKAARRLEEVCDEQAFTIHRLLGYDGFQFRYNEDNKIETDVVFIDEISMVPVDLFYHLLIAINLENTKIIYAGDHNQLPPVGPGNVLRDILNRNLIPYTKLTEVVRQAGTLKRNSLKILDGHVHGIHKLDTKSHDWKVENHFENKDDLINHLLELYQDYLPRYYPNLIQDVQVLSPMKKRDIGTEYLNIVLQLFLQSFVNNTKITPTPLNQKPKLYPGDKVIQTKNDYKLGIMNGHMGIVKEVDYKKNKFIIHFENSGELTLKNSNLKNISLAYCLTVHKVQGSEFPCVINIVHSSHTIMLHQNLFYTGVSRAKKQSIILGDSKGIYRASKTKQVDKRRTFLSIID